MIARLLERVASGELRVEIDRVFPLSDAAEAHRYIESRQAFGRVLLRPVAHAVQRGQPDPKAEQRRLDA